MDYDTLFRWAILYRNLASSYDYSHLMISHLQLFNRVYRDELDNNCGRWMRRGASLSNLDDFVVECFDEIYSFQYDIAMCEDFRDWVSDQGLDIVLEDPDDMKKALVIGLGVWWGITKNQTVQANCTEIHVVYDSDSD